MLILLTKSRDVKGWMKDIEKQPDRSQFKGDRKKKNTVQELTKQTGSAKLTTGRYIWLWKNLHTIHIYISHLRTHSVEKKTRRNSYKTYTKDHEQKGPYQRSSQLSSGHSDPGSG